MATYSEMVQKVMDWSNRDKESLPRTVIDDALRFAADEAYRQLKVPALEAVYTYTVGAGTSELTIPSNLTEIIQLRQVDANSLTGYVVYGAKSDIRSFYNEYTFKYDDFFYTREQNKLIFCPETTGTETFELYYYGRQPAVTARYLVDTDDTDGVDLTYAYQFEENLSDTEVMTEVLKLEQFEGNEIAAPVTTIITFEGHRYVGRMAPNWLRDQNERILLFGALAESFDYLMEQQQSQIFRAKFNAEIQALNQEDKMRLSRGGNVQTHFISPLI